MEKSEREDQDITDYMENLYNFLEQLQSQDKELHLISYFKLLLDRQMMYVMEMIQEMKAVNDQNAKL